MNKQIHPPVENQITLKYQYHVQVWGGFYNEQYRKIHGYTPGDYHFDTEEGRSLYLRHLHDKEEKLNARKLMHTFSQGYTCDTRCIAHRVVEFQGKRYYSFRELPFNYDISAAEYWIKEKWYPGFNDFTLEEIFGKDFDYDNADINIIQEWITGAFTVPSNTQ